MQNRDILLSILVLVIGYPVSSWSADCSPERMNELRASASSLNARTLTLSASLAACPEYRDEALLWASFYYHQNGQYDQSLNASSSVQKNDAISDRYQILARASQGSYQQLQGLVDSGAAGYAGDAESHLVLARALTRARRSDLARPQYEKYLQLKPDDLDVRIEEAHSYLWNDDWRQAEKRFQYLSNLALSEGQKRTVAAALEQVQNIKVRKESEAKNQAATLPLGFERVWNSFKGFSRQSLLTGYHTDRYRLDAAVVSLNSEDPTTQQTAGEILVSKNFSLSSKTDFFAKAGWLQGVGGNYTVAGVLTTTMKSGIKPMVGFESSPLVKIAPIPTQFTNWSQESAFVGFRFKERVEYRLWALNATDQGSAMKHSLLVQMPLRIAKELGDLSLQILAESLAAQRYSPYIYSPRESTVILPGAILQTKIDDESEVKVNLNYGFVSERLNDGAPTGTGNSKLQSSSSGQLFGFGLKYLTKIEKDFDVDLNFQYDRTSSGSGVTYQSGLVYAGLIWRLDEEPASAEEKRP